MGKLRVLLFASARQAAGSAETSLAFDEDRIDEEIFWARLLEKFPSLAQLRGSVRIARNREYLAAGGRMPRLAESAMLAPPPPGLGKRRHRRLARVGASACRLP